MPYVKKSTDTMRRLLNTYELNTGSRLAPVLGVSIPTACRRIKTPAELTVHELRLLVTRGHVPIDELRAAL